MPKNINADDMEEVLFYVRAMSGQGGARLAGLMAVLTKLSKGQIQARLRKLIEQEKISREGKNKGTLYFPVAAIEDSAVGSDFHPSEQASSLLVRIRKPMGARKPVGYDSAILSAYKPNETFYLDETLRRELRSLGSQDIEDQPAGTYLRQILDRLLIDLSYNSSRLEGNTYSLLETTRLIEGSEQVSGKAETETVMILNHKRAIEMLAEEAEEIGFNRYTVQGLHALLSDGLMSNPGFSGRIRERAVGISGSVFRPLEGPQRIEEHFELFLEKAEAIVDPFEQAFFTLVQIPYLQPFEDVNKRVSRLAANIPLIRHNLTPLSFVDVSQTDYVEALLVLYELGLQDALRELFVWAYGRSCAQYSAIRQSLVQPDPFRLRYREHLGELIARVVKGGLVGDQAGAEIQSFCAELPESDRDPFARLVDLELRSLHIGNIARFRIRPGEFAAWKKRNEELR